MTENKKLADNLKVVFNLLAQCTLPPTPVGKAGDVQKVLDNFRAIIDLIDKGELVVTKKIEETPEEIDGFLEELTEEVTDATE